jgi:hypothetical protein
MQDMNHRIDNLKQGKVFLQKFIDTLVHYNLLHESESSKIDENRVRSCLFQMFFVLTFIFFSSVLEKTNEWRRKKSI